MKELPGYGRIKRNVQEQRTVSTAEPVPALVDWETEFPGDLTLALTCQDAGAIANDPPNDTNDLTGPLPWRNVGLAATCGHFRVVYGHNAAQTTVFLPAQNGTYRLWGSRVRVSGRLFTMSGPAAPAPNTITAPSRPFVVGAGVGPGSAGARRFLLSERLEFSTGLAKQLPPPPHLRRILLNPPAKPWATSGQVITIDSVGTGSSYTQGINTFTGERAFPGAPPTPMVATPAAYATAYAEYLFASDIASDAVVSWECEL